ncbi:amidohydrolase family protein [Kocuria marina]|uniref:amidohydrolase family protein n=1 Tax=Kocuria marina TaxID=223184 RepID=UPI0021B6E287|nr:MULTISPECIES: amidohydrolase family protein [Kocuria]MCT2020872.1 amidohydrolase family protein [Kocuria marina]
MDAGSVPGPRVFPSGALISRTGGHGDFSPAYAAPVTLGGRPSRFDEIGVFAVANGTAEVQAAVRTQLKRGASQIKLALGGGVISDSDPLDALQYTSDEISAAVQTAADWGTHVYNVEGIQRAIRAGVRSIEHGHLVDEETLDEMARKNAWLSLQPFQKSDNPLTGEQLKKAEPTSHWDRVAQWAKERGGAWRSGRTCSCSPGSWASSRYS